MKGFGRRYRGMSGRANVLIALIVLVPVLGGCLGDEEAPRGSGPESTLPPIDASLAVCDVDDGADASGNAPMLASFTRDPEAVAARFADALRDPLVPGARAPNGWTLEWDTRGGGYVHHEVEGDGGVDLLWWNHEDARADASDEELDALLDAVLDAFGIHPENATRHRTHENDYVVTLRQIYPPARSTVVNTAAHFSAFDSVTLSFSAFHDLSDAEVRVNVADAESTAAAHVRCVLDESGRTRDTGYACAPRESLGGPSLYVWSGSLGYNVYVDCETPGDPGHCGLSFFVIVDVETGALLHSARPACD